MLTAAGLCVSAQAALADDDELYKTKNCFACHRIDKNHHGPSFKSVAAKYAGDAAAEERLTLKVREGGGGVWGATPMPAQTQVTQEEAATLVRWILRQK